MPCALHANVYTKVLRGCDRDGDDASIKQRASREHCVDRLDPRLIRGDAFISKCSFIAISSSVISFGSPVDVVSSSPTNTGVVERSLFVVNFFFFFSVFSPRSP